MKNANTGAVLLVAAIVDVALTEEQADFIAKTAEKANFALNFANSVEILKAIKAEGFTIAMVEYQLMTPEEGAEALGF